MPPPSDSCRAPGKPHFTSAASVDRIEPASPTANGGLLHLRLRGAIALAEDLHARASVRADPAPPAAHRGPRRYPGPKRLATQIEADFMPKFQPRADHHPPSSGSTARSPISTTPALLDTTHPVGLQQIPHPPRRASAATNSGSYLELVIAVLRLHRTPPDPVPSRSWGPRSMSSPAFSPKPSPRPRLLKSGILKEARATFSVVAGLEALPPLPVQRHLGEELYLAGDWTQTGWPSTMEGAVRSGRLAAAAVLRHQQGTAQTFSSQTCRRRGLMRLLNPGNSSRCFSCCHSQRESGVQFSWRSSRDSLRGAHRTG